jgi:hypothetical protein
MTEQEMIDKITLLEKAVESLKNKIDMLDKIYTPKLQWLQMNELKNLEVTKIKEDIESMKTDISVIEASLL